MRLLRNMLAIIGFLAVVGVGFILYNIWDISRDLGPGAFGPYHEFATKLLKTRDIADALVWAVPVEEGVSAEDVKESIKSQAVSHNFLLIGDSPCDKPAAVSGQPLRHVSVMSFCDLDVGIQMMDQNNAYSAFMPYTISLVEDPQGKLWLYTLNMDFLIHGAKELPPELKTAALKARRTLREIMEGAAKGKR